MDEIFLSYAGTERNVAAHVARGLRAAGVAVWWDQDGIGWGDNWIERIQGTLARCTGFIIIVGTDGVSRWTKAEMSLAYRRHIEQGLPLFPLLLPDVTPEDLPPFLGVLQGRSLPYDLSDYDYHSLAAELRTNCPQKNNEDGHGAHISGASFPGLLPYEERDASNFYGRQLETLEVMRLLGSGLDGVNRRWLQVEGPSGVGKSSLVRAGLIPAVRRGWLEEHTEKGVERWVVIVVRPGTEPLENLSATLERELLGLSPSRMDDLRFDRKPNALGYLVKAGLQPAKRLLVVIDQFEELFTLTTDLDKRQAFDSQVAGALVDQDARTYLITTVRADFVLRFGEIPRLLILFCPTFLVLVRKSMFTILRSKVWRPQTPSCRTFLVKA